jgi:hypothetical protein
MKYGGTNGKKTLGDIPTTKQAFMDIQTHL